MISVVIVDDERDVREGLQKVVDRTDGIHCLGTYQDGEAAYNGIRLLQPDVVLMDVHLPRMSGIECVQRLKDELPGLNIIMLSGFSRDEEVLEAFQAGALGFLNKAVFPSKLIAAIREVINGGSPMSPSIARKLVSYFNDFRNPVLGLSARERDVLHQLCKGHSYKDIASSLYVSPNTIRFHLKNIYKKLKVHSRHEAVMKAMRAGMA